MSEHTSPAPGKFRARRRVLELTQAQLAARTDLSVATIRAVEGIYTPSSDTLGRIDRALSEAEAEQRQEQGA